MEADKKQLLQKLCHMYLCNQNDEARRLIVESAQITPEEKAHIPQGKMGEFIFKNRKEPHLHKMVEIERAFFYADLIYSSKDDVDTEDALFAVERLQNIVPYAFPEEQIYIKHRQARCYGCVELTSDEQDNANRFKLYRDIIEHYPVKEKDRDSFLMSWAKYVTYLNVSTFDKYEAVKLAQRKSSDYGKYAYKEMLAPLAQDYFSLKLNKAKNSEYSYADRYNDVKNAQKVIEDIDIPADTIKKYQDDPRKLQELRDIQKHKHKLAVFGCLKNVYKEYHREADVRAVSLQIGKEQNEFYKKYPHLRMARIKVAKIKDI